MKSLGIFLRGFLMGICDVIPGVSGGTIAFITGIYERLINAVKGFDHLFIRDFFLSIGNGKKFMAVLKRIDFFFLLALGIGIISAIVIGSHVVTYLLETYFVYTISFFIGLILMSSRVIYKNIESHKLTDITLGIIGLVIGIGLTFMIPATVEPTLWYVLLGGFIAISAMFLPGISGAFLLLIMGIYEFMLSVIHDILGQFSFFIAFIIGALIGVIVISRFISFLFSISKSKTLYVLLGLVIGSLSIPLQRIGEYGGNYSLGLSILLFFAGGLLVYLVGKLEVKHGANKA